MINVSCSDDLDARGGGGHCAFVFGDGRSVSPTFSQIFKQWGGLVTGGWASA